MDNIILDFREISKSFTGVRALDNVSFAVKRGEVHSIMGENGAGKSTLMKIAAGLLLQDSGQIYLNEQNIHIKNAHQALKLGIAMVPQELNLVPEMTVAENILLGIEPRHILGIVDRKELHRKASEALASLGMTVNTQQMIKKLSIAEQQIIQIARAIVFRCNILIMDEPTASLSEREKRALFELLRRLNQRRTTILYITHRIKEVFEISDRITVLRDGKLTGTRVCSETNEDEIIRLMVGRPLREFLRRREQRKRGGEVVLEVHGLTRKNLFKDISFSLNRGEILGIAGLVGARRTETFNSLIGFPPPEKGEVFIEGRPVSIKSPLDAVRLGIGYLPEERRQHGIFPIMSVLHNMSIPFLKRLQCGTVISRKKEELAGTNLSQQLHIQTPSLNKQIAYLSGGNQQKVILARWLGSRSKILIMDEPTRGIDVGAKVEIHTLICNLADKGESIIMISSEIQELLAITDKILVMHEGSIVGSVDPESSTEEDILRIAMGEDQWKNESI